VRFGAPGAQYVSGLLTAIPVREALTPSGGYPCRHRLAALDNLHIPIVRSPNASEIDGISLGLLGLPRLFQLHGSGRGGG
jgi:hypothetical protein